MSRATLLIEIGCEEIPARMLPQAAHDVAAVVTGLLDKGALSYGTVRSLWTPRRLALVVELCELESAAREETIVGPPASAAFTADGKPTGAAIGFAKKNGIDVAQLQRIAGDKGEYAAAVIRRPPRSVGDVLAAGFERGIAAISFPKTMHWGSGEHEFVRPVHWLVALAGAELLPLSLFGVAADRVTRGHRGLDPGPHSLPSADAYETTLERLHVIVDPALRRSRLDEALHAGAAALKGELLSDHELLDESNDIVEWPGALVGSFEPEYVAELPGPVLSTCLRHHQKAFSIGRNGGLLPAFAVAVNMPGDPGGHIRRGHEWVVGGRLADARFFWREDRTRSLASRAERLEGVVFHRDLGSYAAKSRRLEQLVVILAERVGIADQRTQLARGAALSRCDLTTGLVGEFPELQGVVGGLLASADGETNAVADLIAGLYLPSAPEDPLPASRGARLLGIADRLDTLVGGFAAGLAPTGSKDPFALRRAGAGLIRLAIEEPALDLLEAARAALALYDGANGPELKTRTEATIPLLAQFLFERFEVNAERVVPGVRYDELAAVREAARHRFDALDLLERLRGLTRFRASDDFRSLAAAAKRVANILQQAAEKGETIAPRLELRGLQQPEEKQLGAAVMAAAEQIGAAERGRDYVSALSALAGLRPAVDRFFDKVLVMDPDPELRQARLGLLAELNRWCRAIVEIEQLVVEGN